MLDEVLTLDSDLEIIFVHSQHPVRAHRFDLRTGWLRAELSRLDESRAARTAVDALRTDASRPVALDALSPEPSWIGGPQLGAAMRHPREVA